MASRSKHPSKATSADRLLPVHFYPLLVPAIVGGGLFFSQDYTLAAFSGCFLVVLIHPLLDAICGTEAGHADTPKTANDGQPAFSALLWLYAALQLAILAAALWWCSHVETFSAIWIGAMLSIGAQNGALGITVAHELIHRRRPEERALGIALLISVCYGHYRVEHVFGHHRSVGTSEDPGSARYGESLYAFVPRTLLGEWRSAWYYEQKRLAKTGGRLLHNRILLYAATQVAVLFTVGLLLGLPAALFFLGQSAVAVLLLEAVAYIEHYGLARREIAPRQYEAVRADHTWDTSRRMTNWFLFNLGRHSHHHLQSATPYEGLRNLQKARLLPYGYSTMLLIALIPSLWRRVVHPLIEDRRS